MHSKRLFLEPWSLKISFGVSYVCLQVCIPVFFYLSQKALLRCEVWIILLRHFGSCRFWTGNSDMFPVSICEEQIFRFTLFAVGNKTELPQWVDWIFGMLFSSVSIREAVLIHSGNLMKSSPVSSTHLLSAHPTDRAEDSESIIEHLYRKLPAQHFSFSFPLRLVASFS